MIKITSRCIKLVKINTKNITLAALALLLLFFLIRFSTEGFTTIAGFLIISLPIYYILKPFDNLERLFFAFFIAIGIFPTVVYPLALIMGLKLSIALTFILFLIIGYLVNKKKTALSY